MPISIVELIWIGANLSGTNLSKANLDGADLSGAYPSKDLLMYSSTDKLIYGHSSNTDFSEANSAAVISVELISVDVTLAEPILAKLI